MVIRRMAGSLTCTLILVLAGCASFACKAPKPQPAAPQSQQPAAPQPQRPNATAPVSTQSPVSAEALGIYRSPSQAKAPPTKDELSVIASAKTLLGKPPNADVVVNGKSFTLDCIGTVCAIYYKLWLDLTKDFARYSGNGVTGSSRR